jgi:hypothetical protein
MSGMMWQVVCTLVLSTFAFFVPLGPQKPSSTFARTVFVACPLLLLATSQYLWATTGSGLIERGTCFVAPTAKSCLSSEGKKVANFNEICPAALANAQELDWVPYIATLPTLAPQPRGNGHYRCRAEGRGNTYLITVALQCSDFTDHECVLVYRVEKDTGEVLWDRSILFG